MPFHKAKVVLIPVLIGLGFSLISGPIPSTRTQGGSGVWADPSHPEAERTVFLTGNFGDENLIQFTANFVAAQHPGLFLLDTPKSKPFLKLFLEKFGPHQIPPIALWPAFFPKAEALVVCPATPRRLFLQGACLAGILHVPFVVDHGDSNEMKELRRTQDQWKIQKIYALGESIHGCADWPHVKIIPLANEETVAATYIRRLSEKGTIHNLVIANPEDNEEGMARMSSLAPWIAVQHRAALLLTNPAGDNVAALVDSAIKNSKLRKTETLILTADLKAIPMETRPNPIAGKDAVIEMEPMTPRGSEPFSFSIGRLFHEDPGVVALMMARQRLMTSGKTFSRALVASNAGEGLPLLETFSQTTARELANSGFQTKTLFGNEVNKDDLRRMLPEADIFLWEGHHNTLINEYGFPKWDEPLRPSLVFLQSCLALTESKAHPLLERGSVAVVGSSTRIYSASGGAFSLAFFDGLLYEGQTLGGSLRQAKNFLLAYALLKEKRLGNGAKMTGANLRSAWAFSLWGDPTLILPLPQAPADALPAVRHQVQGNTIAVSLPEIRYEKTATVKYYSQMIPNQRLAGLITSSQEEHGKHLVPMVFVEIPAPKAPAGKVPQLTSRLPASHYVFCWDRRRKCGYLLVAPGLKDREELRFHVKWEGDGDAGVVRNSSGEVVGCD